MMNLHCLSFTETGTFPAAKEENQQTKRDLDKKDTEQVS